jgi:DNA polymerase-1
LPGFRMMRRPSICLHRARTSIWKRPRSLSVIRLETSRLRALGKEIVLGLNNGRSAYSISESLTRLGFGFDVDDVQGMILRYNMKFSGMNAWRDGIESSALNDGFVSTPLGRRSRSTRIRIPIRLINYPVQGTAADGFKMALIRLDDELAGQDARIVHILHDEVIVEARRILPILTQD